MYKLLSIAFFFLFIQANAQTTYKYYNPKHFKGYSIVFTKEYKANFLLREFKEQFTPAKKEIDSAEAIFMRRYDVDINKKEAYISTNNPVKFFKYYLRQYMGLINLNDEKVILIKMLNVPKPRRKTIEEHYENWESKYVLGTGDFYERNTVPFLVNLTTGEISVF
ncbi:hypothetical protein F0919_02445 [Taibaiella lutea]|uniref:Uncharacterized protein n=1 Tax=Taibaiella lutea TaxID=2608001 RepID=A0A5M6CNB1_9BACT|nr:hypothetical protein [Taibaiella lutea]KAA5536547.1 hypothetical protein F0919_02445 [Taibaiella lutea]